MGLWTLGKRPICRLFLPILAMAMFHAYIKLPGVTKFCLSKHDMFRECWANLPFWLNGREIYQCFFWGSPISPGMLCWRSSLEIGSLVCYLARENSHLETPLRANGDGFQKTPFAHLRWLLQYFISKEWTVASDKRGVQTTDVKVIYRTGGLCSKDVSPMDRQFTFSTTQSMWVNCFHCEPYRNYQSAIQFQGSIRSLS